MSIKNPLTLAGIELATFRFVVQHLNHCATAVPTKYIDRGETLSLCVTETFITGKTIVDINNNTFKTITDPNNKNNIV
jgi:hypothetical protein